MFLYSHWLKLNAATKIKLADKFNIKKTGSVHVSNNEVVYDGYAIKDVENGLNLNAVKAYLETEENDMALLWQPLVDKIEGKTPAVKFEEKIIKDLNTPVPGIRWNPVKKELVTGTVYNDSLLVDVPKKKKGRPAKKK